MMINIATTDEFKRLDIDGLLANYERKKEAANIVGDEQAANDCWRHIEAINLNRIYIGAFEKIKEKRYRDAWCDLEQCEIKAKFISNNSSSDFLASSRVSFIKDKVELWQSLFPYNLFLSPGFIVGYHSCSVCDHIIRPRSRCKHVKGKIYNGNLCLHVVHDMEMTEISLVTNPVQKSSVANAEGSLDYSLVEYLSELLDNAYDQWSLERRKKKFPIDKFSSVTDDSDCPCRSGTIFVNCCANKKGIEIPHIDVIVENHLLDKKCDVKFPY
jgi:hypothetical protein